MRKEHYEITSSRRLARYLYNVYVVHVDKRDAKPKTWAQSKATPEQVRGFTGVATRMYDVICTLRTLLEYKKQEHQSCSDALGRCQDMYKTLKVEHDALRVTHAALVQQADAVILGLEAQKGTLAMLTADLAAERNRTVHEQKRLLEDNSFLVDQVNTLIRVIDKVTTK